MCLFLSQVRTSEDLNLVTKVTNTTPHFVASDLDPGTAYTLHVSVHSPMGASTPIKLQAFTVKTAEKRMGKHNMFSLFNRFPFSIILCFTDKTAGTRMCRSNHMNVSAKNIS